MKLVEDLLALVTAVAEALCLFWKSETMLGLTDLKHNIKPPKSGGPAVRNDTNVDSRYAYFGELC